MSKFKIGDKVYTKSFEGIQKTFDCNKKTEGCSFLDGMKENCEGYYTVKRVESYSNDKLIYRFIEIEHFWKPQWINIRIKDTKIARKMNKNNINKIESGWIYLK